MLYVAARLGQSLPPEDVTKALDSVLTATQPHVHEHAKVCTLMLVTADWNMSIDTHN